jgi:hypothetical protein
MKRYLIYFESKKDSVEGNLIYEGKIKNLSLKALSDYIAQAVWENHDTRISAPIIKFMMELK